MNCSYCGAEFEPSKWTIRRHRTAKFRGRPTYCGPTCSGKGRDGFSSDDERFWAKVDKSGDCWIWTASLRSNGYGQFVLRGAPVVASRVAWELTYGAVPAELWVLHKCDNPPCVRPDHLFLGDAQENVDDMWAKGRQKSYENMMRGADISRAGFTDDIVLGIRRSYAEGNSTMRDLASDYGVAFNTIWQIVRRRSWTHI